MTQWSWNIWRNICQIIQALPSRAHLHLSWTSNLQQPGLSWLLHWWSRFLSTVFSNCSVPGFSSCVRESLCWTQTVFELQAPQWLWFTKNSIFICRYSPCQSSLARISMHLRSFPLWISRFESQHQPFLLDWVNCSMIEAEGISKPRVSAFPYFWAFRRTLDSVYGSSSNEMAFDGSMMAECFF